MAQLQSRLSAERKPESVLEIRHPCECWFRAQGGRDGVQDGLDTTTGIVATGIERLGLNQYNGYCAKQQLGLMSNQHFKTSMMILLLLHDQIERALPVCGNCSPPMQRRQARQC